MSRATAQHTAPGTVRPPSRSAARRLADWSGTLLLAVLLVLVLYPLVWMAGSSLKSPTEIASNLAPWPTELTWSNFSQGWSGSSQIDFARFFANSLVLAVLSVIGTVTSCTLAAYAFARLHFPLRRVWFAITIGTLLLPGHVLIAPQFVVFRELGLVGTIVPLVAPKFLATEAFFVFLTVQFIRGIPRDLDQAALIDGCGPWSTFRHVILPLCRPAMVASAVFSFIWTWNDFFSQLVYLSDLDSYTVPVGLQLFLDSTGRSDIGPMMAMSVVSLLPVFLFFLAFQRLLVEGINTGGVKG